MYTKEQRIAYRKAHLAEHREHSRTYRAKHPEKIKEYEKKHCTTDACKAYKRKRWHEKYVPHPRIRKKFLTGEEQTKKRKARVKAQSALKQGILKKEVCAFCGNKESQMHHPDYSKPLEVMWVCRKDHLEIHRTG